MKVESITTRVYSIPQTKTKNQSISASLNNSEPLGPIVRISFKGNAEKNFKQLISYSAEDKGLGLPEYNPIAYPDNAYCSYACSCRSPYSPHAYRQHA